MSSSSTYRKKLVIMLSRFPYPLEKGDKLRAFHQIKELSKTYAITLLATTDCPVKKECYSKDTPIGTIRIDRFEIPA